MRKIFIIIAIFSFLAFIVLNTVFRTWDVQSPLEKLKEQYENKEDTKAVDHSQFSILKQVFEHPSEVTKACVSCHNLTSHQVMNSSHWNWEREEYVKGKGVVYLGKKNAINNFCISSEGNEPSCAKCHIGFGMDSKGKVFTDSVNIDCLVCHDNTETYSKAPEKGGAPSETVNLSFVAQNVGRPRRSNCGICHFYGGGGNNVKHGDLEKAMFEPTKEIDVHMGVDGANMQCVDCHVTKQHNISGRLYSLSSMNRNRVFCEQCHLSEPHTDEILNEHTLKVSCQTCHIPIYAKVNATKTYWDWSTAGKLRNGQPYVEEDSVGNDKYMSIKGTFVWGKNLRPDYIWFNGSATHYLKGDIIEDTTKVVVLNKLFGSYSDWESKIYPVKTFRAKQPFDPINKILISPKLYAERKGEGGFWKDFDWIKSSEIGMKLANLPFSGKVSFIETEMYWPVNHMVAPKGQSLQCKSCHTRNGSRLAGLTDFYLPGRDSSATVEFIGKWLVILVFIGVVFHGSLRIYNNFRNKQEMN